MYHLLSSVKRTKFMHLAGECMLITHWKLYTGKRTQLWETAVFVTAWQRWLIACKNHHFYIRLIKFHENCVNNADNLANNHRMIVLRHCNFCHATFQPHPVHHWGHIIHTASEYLHLLNYQQHIINTQTLCTAAMPAPMLGGWRWRFCSRILCSRDIILSCWYVTHNTMTIFTRS